MNLGFREILPIILLVALLFGAKKIPQMLRGLGDGIREFKKASRDPEPTNQSRNHAPTNESREEG